jgi:phage gp36-like protein
MAWATTAQLSQHLPQWQQMLLRQGESLPANLEDVTARAQDILEESTAEARDYMRNRYALTMDRWAGGTELSVARAVCRLAVWQIVTNRYSPLAGDAGQHEPWRSNWKAALRWLEGVRAGHIDLEDALSPKFINRVHSTAPAGGQVFR